MPLEARNRCISPFWLGLGAKRRGVISEATVGTAGGVVGDGVDDTERPRVALPLTVALTTTGEAVEASRLSGGRAAAGAGGGVDSLAISERCDVDTAFLSLTRSGNSGVLKRCGPLGEGKS